MKSQPANDTRSNTSRLTRSGASTSAGNGRTIQGPSPPKKQGQRAPPAKSKKGSKGKRGGGKFKVAYTNRKATRILSESGNNELSKDELSYLTDEEKLLLSSWGLPRSVLDKYRAKGITSLFPWQLDCLANEKVLEGCNLLYSAPTSAGKTMVAEILMIKRVLELGKKAMMILPFVSVAREKMFSLQELFGDAGVRVEGFMGTHNPPGGFQQIDIAICTIEKANSLINRMLEEGTLSQLGTIVVDELHLIGDPHRGYLLELLLTKIRYMTSQKSATNMPNGNGTNEEIGNTSDIENNSTSTAPKLQIQIVGMSATLPNLDLLAKWLQAELVITDYRPVPLVERILIGDSFYDRELNLIRPVAVDLIPFVISNDQDHIVYLCLETVLAGHSILVFCPTKAMCENVALQISREFFHIGNIFTVTSTPEVSEALRNQLDGTKLRDVLKQLEQCPAGKDENLWKAVSFGVAFHHAGLTFDERDIVESAFKRGIVRVIVATSTLSAGVNLPARRVLIKPPDFGNNLDVLTYHQMSGRAGRKGVDTEGESVLICNGASRGKSVALIQSALQPVSSALLGDRGELTSSMKRALLEVIASGVASTPAQVKIYARSTLLSYTIELGIQTPERNTTSPQETAHLSITECLEFLVKNDFIRLKVYESEGRECEYMPTQLGSACLASSLPPDEGIIVFKELEKARRCFVLENELHIIYQVTPIYVADQWGNSLDWHQFFKLWESLSPDQQKVGELVGVQESFIIKAWQGMVSSKNPKQFEMLTVHTRFYTALALSDLVNEVSMSEVCEKYRVNKGVVQNLQQAASTFAGMVTAFCSRLGWANLELLLSQFQDRLQFGVQRELVDLVRLPLLNGQRARILYDAGIKCISDLAISEPAQIEHILHKASAFSSAVHGGQQAKSIWVLGKKEGMSETEAASMIVADAREFLKIELGLPDNIQFTKIKTLAPEHNQSICEEAEEEGQEDNGSDSEKENIVLSSFTNASQLEPGEASKDLDMDSSSVMRVSTSDNGKRNNPGYSIFDASADAFEDTFPSMDDFELGQQGQNESERIPDSGEAVQENSVNIQRMLENRANRHNNSSIIANGMNGNPTTELTGTPSDSPLVINGNVLKASTPVNSQGQAKQGQVEDDFDFEREFLQSKFESSHVMEEQNDVMMESMTSFMEVSLVISEEGESPKNKRTSEPFKLSESILAAAVAMADESDGSFTNEGFGGKSIFDDSPPESSEDEIELSPVPVEVPSPSVLRNKTVVNLSANEAGDEIRSFCNATPKKPKQVFKSAQFQGRMIKVRTVEAPQFIPNEFFTGIGPIGVGVLLHSPQRSNSMSKAGIGSKILRSGSVTPISARNPEVEKDHGIALFTDTSDTIWVFQWRSESARGRNWLNNQSKVTELFQRIKDAGKPLVLIDAKEKIKRLLKYCGEHLSLIHFPPENKIWDPKIAEWLLNFDEEHHISLEMLLQAYFDEESLHLKRLGWTQDILDSFWAVKLMAVLKGKLLESQLWEHFTEIEMPSIRPLMLMEINGFGLNSVELDRLKKVLDSKAALLELRAYQLAGRQFNLSSPKDIRQILFREIGLTQPPRTRGTGKDVLARIDHELPKVIMEWRKVTSALTKVVIPFQQDRNLGTGRVHGVYSHFTLTGRVMLSEPSLQCIPRDFDLQLSYTTAQVEEIRHNCRIKLGDKLVSLFFKLENGLQDGAGQLAKSVSMRNAFVPCSEQYTLVAADYCQLELRILAHLCEDTNLRKALNRPGDVFRTMASQWKGIPESRVTDEIRQDTKAITYGIIYGMGAKTLSEQMEVDEMEASGFITQFMRAYPGVRSFIDKTVKFCKEHGYIETMSGRRRYLSHINSRSPAERAQAERQAVNSRIQGSASDLVKTAMAKIQTRLAFLYPVSLHPIDWSTSKNSAKPLAKNGVEAVYFPILNLHDELIYEVRKKDVPDIAREIKVQMESSLKLKVGLPVVVKSGQTWSSLKPYVFPSFGKQNY